MTTGGNREVRDELERSGLETRFAGAGIYLEVDDAATYFSDLLSRDRSARPTDPEQGV